MKPRSNKIKAFLFCNSRIENEEKVLSLIGENDIVVGVDGGVNMLWKIKLRPSVIIGDLDSAEEEALAYFHTEILRYPPEKNETDTELALKWCVNEEINEVVLINGMEGRLDHVWGLGANLLLAKKLKLAAKIITGRQSLFICRHEEVFLHHAGHVLSLLPLSERVLRVNTQGMKYPLQNENLYRHQTRGLSNVIVGDKATITYERGILLGIADFIN